MPDLILTKKSSQKTLIEIYSQRLESGTAPKYCLVQSMELADTGMFTEFGDFNRDGMIDMLYAKGD